MLERTRQLAALDPVGIPRQVSQQALHQELDILRANAGGSEKGGRSLRDWTSGVVGDRAGGAAQTTHAQGCHQPHESMLHHSL